MSPAPSALERGLSRRVLLQSAGATAVAAMLGPAYARAASGRGLKEIVSTPTFDVEVHVDSLEWWGGPGLPAERPYGRERLAADARAREWQDDEPGFGENLERLRPHRVLTQHLPRARLLLEELDTAGIDTACSLIVDHAYETSSYGRKYEVDYDRIFADCREIREAFPGRFLIFAGIDPRRGGKAGADLLRRAVTEHGCSGLGEQVFQQYGIHPADREACYPLYEVCVELGVPFYGNCEGPAQETMPLEYEQVAKDFPELKICLAGAGRPRTAGETTEAGWKPTEDARHLAATYEHVYLDTADWWRRDEANIRRYLSFLRSCFDSDARTKVMFASDYPVFVAMGPAKSWVDVVLDVEDEGMRFTDEEIVLYYSKNPMAFLASVLQ